MLDLRRLEVLHRFSVCGSIAATAASLGYSPSAISKQLSTLEREVGAILLERTARSATLTDAGRLLATHAAHILAHGEQAESDLASHVGSINGSLVVSTVQSLAITVATALATVQREHSALDIVMRQTASAQGAADVVDQVADIAVIDDWTSRPGPWPVGVTSRRIYTEPVVLAVPPDHELAGRTKPLNAREFAAVVAGMTWLCAPHGHSSRLAVDRRLDDAAAVPLRRWEFEGLITVAELVAGGTGCGLLPETVARTQTGGLHTIPLTPRMVRHVHAVTRTSAATHPATVRCLDTVTEHLLAVRVPGKRSATPG